jgi:uncharacterized protein YndB with AHSA1/START domain
MSDPSGSGVLELTRVFGAPRERVFDALTDPH